MIKTFEIDLDDALVENASEIFETLGTDIDTAIKMFLTQATLRQGFPFEVVIPSEETENGNLKIENEATSVSESPVETESAPADDASSASETVPTEPELDSLHEGVSEEEENALATATESASIEESAPVPPISAEVAARVAANEALVAEMREEIGDKAVTPEFDENEDDGTHGDYDSAPAPAEEEIPPQQETVSEPEHSETEDSSSPDEDEEEDETTPDNLFDAWDVGEEEDIGCR